MDRTAAAKPWPYEYRAAASMYLPFQDCFAVLVEDAEVRILTVAIEAKQVRQPILEELLWIRHGDHRRERKPVTRPRLHNHSDKLGVIACDLTANHNRKLTGPLLRTCKPVVTDEACLPA